VFVEVDEKFLVGEHTDGEGECEYLLEDEFDGYFAIFVVEVGHFDEDLVEFFGVGSGGEFFDEGVLLLGGKIVILG
jgi:hypothetical protein